MHNKIKKDNSKNFSFTYPKIVAIGFAVIILAGAALLMLPASSKNGSVSFIDALFTAASATCITGLVPFDTYTSWTLFGQIVIICMIQIGGLGFITVLSLITNIIKKKISLKQKMLLKESIGSLNIGEVKELVKSVVILTAVAESVGAIILAARFIPLAGWEKGLFMSVFTSISAYCNAGFDLMGYFSPSSSLTTVNNDPIIILTVSLLIITGGLGFLVWQDIKQNKFHIKSLSVHTKLVLVTTAFILISGTVLFYIFEKNNELKDMNFANALLNAFFSNVTTRTAGFNSINIDAMSSQSKMLTIILMFIGGSSGSTAGGVKTTTVAVLFLCVISTLKNSSEVNAFGRRITADAIKKAISICLINLIIIFAATTVISNIQSEFTLLDVIFECTSAIGTVGMTTGITSELNTISQIIIISMMYIGRLTSLIFALSFTVSKPKITTQKPKGNVMIG